MAEIIEDGTGKGYKAKVNKNNELEVKAISEHDISHVSHFFGEAYMVQAIDAGPGGGEYTLYFKNTDSRDFIVDNLYSYVTDTDVVWKLVVATGTAAGASVITSVNLNLGSGNAADALCRGGAGGVTGLTPSTVIFTIYGGAVFNSMVIPIEGALVIPKNYAVAFEYDAGTGGAATIGFDGHYDQD